MFVNMKINDEIYCYYIIIVTHLKSDTIGMYVSLFLLFIRLIDFWCLPPLSPIFQLYHDDQF